MTDFDWDTVLVTKDPEQKEVVISFPGDGGFGANGSLNSDAEDPGGLPVDPDDSTPIIPESPDNGLGGAIVPEDVAPAEDGFPECVAHDCDAVEDLQAEIGNDLGGGILIALPEDVAYTAASQVVSTNHGGSIRQMIDNQGNLLDFVYPQSNNRFGYSDLYNALANFRCVSSLAQAETGKTAIVDPQSYISSDASYWWMSVSQSESYNNVKEDFPWTENLEFSYPFELTEYLVSLGTNTSNSAYTNWEIRAVGTFWTSFDPVDPDGTTGVLLDRAQPTFSLAITGAGNVYSGDINGQLMGNINVNDVIKLTHRVTVSSNMSIDTGIFMSMSGQTIVNDSIVLPVSVTGGSGTGFGSRPLYCKAVHPTSGAPVGSETSGFQSRAGFANGRSLYRVAIATDTNINYDKINAAIARSMTTYTPPTYCARLP